ncbi:MAG: hypothetical protein M1840_004558 [Geoglossum simile]|nr:MAG: hypothetical protein M1840_004558 [Geoglossum simile]
MTGNRKLTEFFTATTTTPNVSNKGSGAGDTIVVVSKDEDDIKCGGAATRMFSKGRSPHRDPPAPVGQPEVGVAPPQSAVISRDKPVVRRGGLMVRSSDGEDTDSDSSFEDLDVILSTSIGGAMNAPVKYAWGRSNRQYLGPRGPPAAPSYKFSMASLVMQAKKDSASDADAARARAALRPEHGQGSPVAHQGVFDTEATGASDDIHCGLLASIISEKREGGSFQKVLSAMKRTEALNRDKVWYFFERGSPARRTSLAPFPALSIVPNGLGEAIMDPITRQHTFLSGFFGDMAALGRDLPIELVEWILNALCLEKRDDLRHAYCVYLRTIASPVNCTHSPETIRQIFRSLGGSDEATTLGKITHPAAGTPLVLHPIANIASHVQSLGVNAGNMPSNTKEYTICILARLTIDKCIVGNSELQMRIEDAIASLISSIAEEQKEELGDLLDVQRIIRELEKPEFNIDSGTDYTRLASLISMVDICIDDGAPLSGFCDKDQENAFNTDIDNLAKHLKSMFTKIVDTGASYMARTEAKEVLERVHYRLVFAVRTKERPKKSIFQSNFSDGTELQSDMTKFLSRAP